MPRQAAGLTAAKVKTAGPGRYGDGDGLYLLVRPNGTRFWVFRYVRDKRMREIGLGRVGTGDGAVPLKEAREKSGELRATLRGKVDPLQKRAVEAEAAKKAEAEKAKVTFRVMADAYIAAHEKGWSNHKHHQQWRNTLDTYAYPTIGDLPVADITTAHIRQLLEPIWMTKPETAGRVRGRIEVVLEYAAGHGHREGDNPAAWRPHLIRAFPRRSKVAPVEHHAALPWKEAGAFMATLRARAGIAARAFEFAILTAARTGEVLGATWGEIDVEAALWTVAAAKMKGGMEHRVPLSEPALAILQDMAKLRQETAPREWVFPGAEPGRSLSSMALLMVLRRTERTDMTVHGFRSAFKDWATEGTTHRTDIAEKALAHVVGSKVENTYQRGDLLDLRRTMMADWAAFCDRPAGAGGNGPSINAAR